MPFCYECGVQVAPDDPFCGNCGIAQKPLSATPPLPAILSGGLDNTPASLATTAPDATNVTSHTESIENVNPPLAATAAPTEPEPNVAHAPQVGAATEEKFQSVNAHASAAHAPQTEAATPRRDAAPELLDTLVGTVGELIPPEAEPARTAAITGEVVTEIAEPPVADSSSQPEAPETKASETEASETSDASEISDAAEEAVADLDFPETISDFSEASDTPEPVEAVEQESAKAAPPTASVSEPVEEVAHASETPDPIAEPRLEAAPVEAGTASAPDAEASSDEERREAALAAALNDTLPPDAVSRSTGELSSGGRAMDATVPPGSTAGSRRQASKQLESGTVLNVRYEIVRRIGGGGMGAVYLAKDRHLGDAPRAVKEMIETHLDESQHEKAIGDFKRESLLLTSLEHPSIPTIYDYFYDEQAGRFYLVMKYISGGDFASRLRNAPGGRIDEKTATIWGMEVADVLDYLHNRRPRPIIYRDLKPANLMIDGNSGRVMLIDFGIARWVNKTEEKGVTAVGTMGYAPPELFSGKVEPRSDVYSLGATLFHLLTGSDPQDNPLLIFDFTKNPRPRQINPAISVEMERILMRAVEYKPEGRFRSAGEMREALAAHLDRLRVGDVSYGMVTAAQGAGETLQVEMVFCGFCGGRIAADDLFCAHCGAKQPLAGISPSAALQAARSTAKLVVAGTTELDASFLLQKDSNLVGRSDPHSNIFPEVDLSRFDPETKVSRRHARIWRKGETFLVEDLGSVNGTVLLGRDNDTVRLAPHQPRVLENGDKLRLGETMLHFLVG
jgi:serine/threonine-protein kinase